MIQKFQTDLEQFKQKLLSGKSYSEIRKEYLKLLKIYHPDKAESLQKKLYEEYTVTIVNLYQNYMDEKIAAAGADFVNQSRQTNENVDKKTAAAVIPAQDSTYIKLMEIARNEYITYKKIGYGFIPDQAELKARFEKYLKHLGTAVKCYKTVIKEYQNQELVQAARKQLEWVSRLYNATKYDYEFRFNGEVDQRENVVFKRSEL
ncbi:MAG: hypothetical protein J6X78_10475 [Treponema sp.]|nr:hypothetical protein [Treponema sp.]